MWIGDPPPSSVEWLSLSRPVPVNASYPATVIVCPVEVLFPSWLREVDGKQSAPTPREALYSNRGRQKTGAMNDTINSASPSHAVFGLVGVGQESGKVGNLFRAA